MNQVYDNKVEAKIAREFSSSKDVCYLDHAGATLYSKTQMKNIFDDLTSNVYGNPHSLNHSSKQCSDLIDQIRRRILKHFHTTCDEYSLIFTSGATQAIKILFENFDWEANHDDEEVFFDTEASFADGHRAPTGAFLYTQGNHTSVIGAREIAREKKIPFFCLGYDEYDLLNRANHLSSRHRPPTSNSIFAYPAQCNYSGKKYPLDWIQSVRNGVLDFYGLKGIKRNSKWFCLLDAATYCSTSDLDLSQIRPDFVCISFYKIFGFPTGLGALLVKNSSAYVLKKSFFGGGTVEIALPCQNFHKKRKTLHERFEDGTISFLSIIALEHGLNTLQSLNLNMALISSHVFELAKYCVTRLKGLKHWNGTDVVQLYAETNYDNIKTQGGIVNFNLKRANQQFIGYVEVLHVANLRKIYIRTGCFCNLGACQKHLNLSDSDLKLYHQAGHVCGDDKDLMNGKPTGSIRVSFGYMSTQDDVDCLVNMIKESFVEVTPVQITPHSKNMFGLDTMRLSTILLFPIKSCGAMAVNSWKLNSKGLEFDREWMIVTSAGVSLTQKQEPRLCMIRPRLNLINKTLTLAFGSDEYKITIPMENDATQFNYNMCQSKVCNSPIEGTDCGDEVSMWLSYHLNTDGLRLIKQAQSDNRVTRGRNAKTGNETENGVKLSFSNQAQFLLINNESVRWLEQLIGPDSDIDFINFFHRFRGNFYVDGVPEFSENKWNNLSIGKVQFKVEGPCGRCQMICIDQMTGEKSRKPLVTLSRAMSGKLQFGIYLRQMTTDDEVFISVGDPVSVKESIE